MNTKTTIITLIIVLSSLMGYAQNRDLNRIVPNKGYVGLYFEDDFFLWWDNNDEQYTGGIELEGVFALPSNKPIFRSSYLITSYGFTVFTPDSIYNRNVVYSDRPYASYQYGSLGVIKFDSTIKSKFRAQLYLGWFGTNFPSRVQNWSHTVLTPDTDSATGWHNQIANGGRFAPNIELEYNKQIFSFPSCRFKNMEFMQISMNAVVNAGGYLNTASAGLKITPLSINSILSSLITPSIPEGLDKRLVEKSDLKLSTRNALNTFRREQKPSYNRGKNWAFNLYALPEIRLIGHSSALEGLLFNDKSVYTLRSSEVKRVVYNFEFGSNIVLARHWHIGCSMQVRSKEHTKFAAKWHTFGAVSIGGTW